MKDRYGLIGYPLGHSFSKAFFTKKFEKENINAEYMLFDIPSIEDFPALIKNNPQLIGLNVTLPYKEKVMAYLDDLDENAREIGAVNVIKFIRSGDSLLLKGYNSDFVGFKNTISPLLKEHHKKALILGTGGASKSVVQALKVLGLDYKFVSRAKQQVDIIHYNELTQDVISEYTVIVNTSPVGTFPNIDESPDIPYQYLTSDHLLYDLVYNPAETTFLKLGKERGAQTKNGEDMLVIQAVTAWDMWHK